MGILLSCKICGNWLYNNRKLIDMAISLFLSHGNVCQFVLQFTNTSSQLLKDITLSMILLLMKFYCVLPSFDYR